MPLSTVNLKEKYCNPTTERQIILRVITAVTGFSQCPPDKYNYCSPDELKISLKTVQFLYPEMLSCGFPFPAYSLHQRMVQFYRAGNTAIGNTASSIPAFIRIEHNWRFARFRIRNKHIHLAYFYAFVAPSA